MDSDHAALAIVVPVLAATVLAAPVLLVWLGATLARAHRATRTDLIGGLGCGLIAAGAAAAIAMVAEGVLGVDESQRLTVYVPLLEETLKAAAIVVAIGVAAVVRGDRLTARRCALATVAVAAAFATGENLGYLGTHLLAGNAQPGVAAAALETLRVRAFLPPVGHLAETWAMGAALWLASRYRRPHYRVAVLLSGWAAAVAVHALWNASALRWWPNPWPLLAIAAVSLAAAAAGGAAYQLNRRATGLSSKDGYPSCPAVAQPMVRPGSGRAGG